MGYETGSLTDFPLTEIVDKKNKRREAIRPLAITIVVVPIGLEPMISPL